MSGKKFKLGLFLGRFQPLHYGHVSAIKQGLEVCEKMILTVGSANRNFHIDNPLIVEERVQLIELMIEKEGWGDRIERIDTSGDNLNNHEWVKGLVKDNPNFDVVVGNNTLVTVLTEFMGKEQFHPELTQREMHQGKIIRHAIMEFREWQDLVPKYSLSLLKRFGFEKRLRKLSVKMD